MADAIYMMVVGALIGSVYVIVIMAIVALEACL